MLRVIVEFTPVSKQSGGTGEINHLLKLSCLCLAKLDFFSNNSSHERAGGNTDTDKVKHLFSIFFLSQCQHIAEFLMFRRTNCLKVVQATFH